MRLEKTEENMVWIKGSAADVRIAGFLFRDPSTPMTRVLAAVSYQVRHSRSSRVDGTAVFSLTDLLWAFVSDDFRYGTFREKYPQLLVDSDTPDWMQHRYGTQVGPVVGRQGKFIRHDNYLNIPGPGVGHDGDSNVSVELDAGIVDAILDLVDSGVLQAAMRGGVDKVREMQVNKLAAVLEVREKDVRLPPRTYGFRG